MPARTAVVLFTRDLRVTDNPALWAASRAERTVPLFVLDEAILGSRFAAPRAAAAGSVRGAGDQADRTPRGDDPDNRRDDRWSRSERAFEAWREGRTDYPLVDAGMRQPTAEGYMHDRARLAVAPS